MGIIKKKKKKKKPLIPPNNTEDRVSTVLVADLIFSHYVSNDQ
jgi:hypothetical protein